MEKCYWFNVALSESQEGEFVRSIHPEINFKYCANKCNGYQLRNYCQNFIPNPKADKQKDKIGRLESLEVFS